jgi:hypothetical protein
VSSRWTSRCPVGDATALSARAGRVVPPVPARPAAMRNVPCLRHLHDYAIHRHPDSDTGHDYPEHEKIQPHADHILSSDV